jgi:bifunctional enzyme CysN/CysC
LCHLIGIRHLVLAVNKMDLVDYDQLTFDADRRRLREFATASASRRFTAIPISGFKGDNITQAPSANTPWYTGPSLIEHLETVEIEALAAQARRSACRCNGSTAPTSTSAASRA